MRELIAHVHIDGVAYRPGQRVPAEVAGRITNPKAWSEPALAAEEPARQVSSIGGQEDAPAEPPRSGKGSGMDAWVAYAQSLGIEVPNGASRDDVIALVDAERG
jgi:hypothetical protein